jgi:hypothetical protein
VTLTCLLKLCKSLGKIDYKNKNLIIGGDFNMHFNTNNKYAFSDLLQSYGLYSHQ